MQSDLAPSDSWLFPKIRVCRYETIEEMKEALTKVIDTITQKDYCGGFQKLLEQYNKCIAAGGDYFEGNKSFMCVLSINVPIRKTSGNLSYAPRIFKYSQIQNSGGCHCSGTTAFIYFWLRLFDTRRETQFLRWWLYYLAPQTLCASRGI